MACQWEISAWGKDTPYLLSAAEQAFELIDAVENSLSVFKASSAVSLINARAAWQPVVLDPQLFDLLEKAVELTEFTEGAFDLTAGILARVWGFTARNPEHPGEDAIRNALKCTGSDKILLNRQERTIRFSTPGVELNFGAFGKGYAIDLAARLYEELAVPGALIHGGTSSAAAVGTDPEGRAWNVRMREVQAENAADAPRVVELPGGRALSWSSGSEQFLDQDGVKYGHIIDPRTGWPVVAGRGALVLCESAAAADALSTAAVVMGEEAFRELCSGQPDIEVWFYR